MRPTISAIAVVVATLASTGAGAATFPTSVDARGRPFVRMEGEVVAGDAAALAATLGPRRGPAPYLVLASPGGDGWEGVRVALMVRDAGLAVAVPAGGWCASSCFSVFASSTERFAARDAGIVVHRAANGDVESPQADHATLDLAGLYRSWGVPLALLGGMATTPHDKGYRLVGPDLAAMARATSDGLPPAGWVGRMRPASVPDDAAVEAALGSLRHGGGGWRPVRPPGSAPRQPPAWMPGTPGWGDGLAHLAVDVAVCSAYLCLAAALRRLSRRFRGRRGSRPAPLPFGVVDIASRR